MLQRSWRNTCAKSSRRKLRLGPEGNVVYKYWFHGGVLWKPTMLFGMGDGVVACSEEGVVAFGAPNLFGAGYRLFSHHIGC